MIATVGHAAVGSLLHDPGAIADPIANAPFMLELNGESWRDWFAVDSLQIDDTLGQPMACEFTLINPNIKPKPGDVVRVLYYSDVLFAGVLSRVEPQPNTPMNVVRYECEATDWSVVLMRRRLRRNFTNVPLVSIVHSILDHELAGEGLSIGTIDSGPTIPLVDVKNSRVFDVLRDVAAATGQSMHVDAAKRLHFLSTTAATAPKVIDETTVEASSLVEDLETYRNVQTVIVTGTPATTTEEKRTVTIVRDNPDQIAARQAIEGGTGRYEDIEEVTHPTSNTVEDLVRMGIGYATLRLATSGVPRTTLSVRIRGYGFRAGQFAHVHLPALGVSGIWLIQRASLREQAARHLVYDLELVQSSRQQRAYEAWLNIVRAGKVVVQLPGFVTSNLVTFNTPGTTTWVVPAGVTQIEITCIGPGGGGGGGDWRFGSLVGWYWDGNGYPGGNGGKAIATVTVTPLEVLDVFIGPTGQAGTNGIPGNVHGVNYTPGTNGTSAGPTWVRRGSLTLCQADGGTYGSSYRNGTPGQHGAGIGDAVTVGGGRLGGAGGTQNAQPQHGQGGIIEIRW
jgi:hypothetical protein